MLLISWAPCNLTASPGPLSSDHKAAGGGVTPERCLLLSPAEEPRLTRVWTRSAVSRGSEPGFLEQQRSSPRGNPLALQGLGPAQASDTWGGASQVTGTRAEV